MKSRRKSILSNPREQSKIILVFALLAAAFIAVNWYVGRNALAELQEGMAKVVLPRVSAADVTVLFEQQTTALDLQLVLFSLLTVFVLVLGSVYLSHKISGPITQLINYFRGVAAGNVAIRKIRFRRRDFFLDLAASINEFQRSQRLLPPEPPEDKTGG